VVVNGLTPKEALELSHHPCTKQYLYREVNRLREKVVAECGSVSSRSVTPTNMLVSTSGSSGTTNSPESSLDDRSKSPQYSLRIRGSTSGIPMMTSTHHLMKMDSSTTSSPETQPGSLTKKRHQNAFFFWTELCSLSLSLKGNTTGLLYTPPCLPTPVQSLLPLLEEERVLLSVKSWNTRLSPPP